MEETKAKPNSGSTSIKNPYTENTSKYLYNKFQTFIDSKINNFDYKYTTKGDKYIAPDGTEFDDEDACKIYEVLLSDKEYKLSKSILVK